jgi:ABC-type multidrug transport system ATPase subunit
MLEIIAEKLSRSFDERPVLRDLDVVFRAGERVVVRGPNGSGKTTLLKILAGVLSPSGGRVRVEEDGAPLDAAARRRATGYIAPDLVLYEEFSPLENLSFFARVRGLPPDPGRDVSLLERLGLGKRRHDAVGTLSTGLRQRAKLAFALQASPRILLLDEPGSNLDRLGRELVEGVVRESGAGDRIVLIATNDPLEFELGTRTLELG